MIRQNHIADVCRSSQSKNRIYSEEVRVCFLVNDKSKGGDELMVFDYSSKEYAIFPCSRNPTAGEVGERLKEFNHSLE